MAMSMGDGRTWLYEGMAEQLITERLTLEEAAARVRNGYLQVVVPVRLYTAENLGGDFICDQIADQVLPVEHSWRLMDRRWRTVGVKVGVGHAAHQDPSTIYVEFIAALDLDEPDEDDEDDESDA